MQKPHDASGEADALKQDGDGAIMARAGASVILETAERASYGLKILADERRRVRRRLQLLRRWSQYELDGEQVRA